MILCQLSIQNVRIRVYTKKEPRYTQVYTEAHENANPKARNPKSAPHTLKSYDDLQHEIHPIPWERVLDTNSVKISRPTVRSHPHP